MLSPDHIDSRRQDLFDILITLVVPGSRRIRVRQFIDDRHGGMTGEYRIEVHVFDAKPAILDLAAGHNLETFN